MSNKFAHNICSCSDFEACCGAIFCHLCFFGRSQHRLDIYPQAPHSKPEGWIGIPCLMMTIASHFGLCCIPVWVQRAEMRNKFDIEGSGCTDCLASTLCTCCAMAQQHVEVKERREKAQLLEDNAAYQSAQDTMVYAQDYQQGGAMPYRGLQPTSAAHGGEPQTLSVAPPPPYADKS